MTTSADDERTATSSPASQEQKAEKKPHTTPQKPRVASAKGKSGKKASPAKKPPMAPRPAKKPPMAPRPAKPAKREKRAGSVREGSKSAKVLELLLRPDGGSLQELMKATGWQPHSVRGFISGTLGKKMGLTVESTKREDGERVYSLPQ